MEKVALRVLVADSHTDSADSCAVLLGLWGYEVRVAYTSQEAQALASAFRPDVVLLDTRLRYDRAREPTATVLGMTCWLTDDDRCQLQHEGIVFCLQKPVDPLYLHRLIEQTATHLPRTCLTTSGPQL